MWIPNPEVLQAGTNPLQLPGDGGQKQPLRATAWIKKEEGGVSGVDGEFKEEEEKTEMGKLTAATRTQEKAKLEEEAAVRGAAGADWREPFLEADTGDPKTTSSTKDTTEVQEAVRPNSGHVLGRAWPLQLHRPSGQEGKRREKRKDIQVKQRKGQKTDSDIEAEKKRKRQGKSRTDRREGKGEPFTKQ
ncbi:hypothetical protein NDU88_003187 [Pleurodeles waltl]|uniref:Uncharacterized protein n=1 Tax=Pleurodeles waltl TaxID=8319 RepID=A0AAV7SET1_PLEWA|nr:hypothetical protein NDU88_003187 [Pleurodeles waltl]